MTEFRHLIVNADDFGRSPGINRGIIHAHEAGILTSASLMVRWPAAAEAAAYACKAPRLSVGLHLDLGEWTVVNGSWKMVYEVVAPEDAAGIAAEIQRQLETFRRIMGCDPTHFDSHQHVHRAEPIRSLLLAEARRLKRVVRDLSPTVRYCGDFYGQEKHCESYPEWISPAALIRICRGLKPGYTEMGCHPGDGADFDSIYAAERTIECASLCDASVQDVIRSEGIRLVSFHDVVMA